MRAGTKIKKDQLCYTLSCSSCRARVVFPLKVPRDKAIEKLIKYNDWVKKGKKIYCDLNCRKFLEDDEKEKPKKMKNEDKKEDENDTGIFWLGE